MWNNTGRRWLSKTPLHLLRLLFRIAWDALVAKRPCSFPELTPRRKRWAAPRSSSISLPMFVTRPSIHPSIHPFRCPSSVVGVHLCVWFGEKEARDGKRWVGTQVRSIEREDHGMGVPKGTTSTRPKVDHHPSASRRSPCGVVHVHDHKQDGHSQTPRGIQRNHGRNGSSGMGTSNAYVRDLDSYFPGTRGRRNTTVRG